MKTRTKSYAVWVDKDAADLVGDWKAYTNRSDDSQLKAKLVIELPEQKIEITESEFDKAVLQVEKFNHISIAEKILYMKRQLGFK